MQVLKNIFNITHSSFRLNFNPLILLFISRNQNRYCRYQSLFFLKVCIYKEVKNTESSYVGVGYTDCLGQKVGFVSSRYIDTSLQH